MTIIIAVVCADSIVVASDSQVSCSSAATSKRMDGEKIHEVLFLDACGILGCSGSVTFGQRAVEVTQSAAAKLKLADYRQLAEVTEKSAREVDNLIMEPYRNATSSVGAVDEIKRQNSYTLLTANYFEGQPHLFALDGPFGIATQQKQYAAVGCGAGVAEFLISWFDFSQMVARDAVVTLGFIIGEVKKADFYCGGATQTKILFPGAAKVIRIDNEAMQMIEVEVEKTSRRYKAEWVRATSKMIHSIAKKMRNEIGR